MIKIDAHQHFWQFDPIRDAWIDDTMTLIRRDFMPQDLQPILIDNGIDGCVAVQADQSEKETEFLLNIATKYDFVKGVVGWVDLKADNIGERLAHYTQHPYFKGVRHIAQAEADDFLLQKKVLRGISHLNKYNLTYDILVYAQQLPAAIELARLFPSQKFVLDHIGKPKISEGVSNHWKIHIEQLAALPNVYCKLSGMVTETAHFSWKSEEFNPFLEIVLSAFGVDRVLYGSDWPVCLLAASYMEQLAIINNYIATLSKDEQAKIMGSNAVSFYNLNH